MVVSPRPQNAENELVRNSFLPHEAMTILSILISQNLPDDSLVWAWTKKGIFTVKSAYHVAHGWLAEGRGLGAGGEESNMNKKKEFWTTIWGLKCPSKVKNFLWRACKNILPTNYCLWLRKVSKEMGVGCVDWLNPRVMLCGIAVWQK